MATTSTPALVTLRRGNGEPVTLPARWIGQALAVHVPIAAHDAGKASRRGEWVISGHVHGYAAGTFRGPLADAIRLARAWDAAFAAALGGDRVTPPNLSRWEPAQQWGRQLRREEPPTGPDADACTDVPASAPVVTRPRLTAADGDGGEQWMPTPTITRGSKPGTVRYALRLPDGRERLRHPDTGRCLRMNGDTAAFTGPDPLTPVFRLWWEGQWVDVPTIAELMHWSIDGACEAPDGRTVEPDAPDSWLTLLGIV